MALGDPNLLRQIEGCRRPALRTADGVLAFISGFGRVGPRARPSPPPPLPEACIEREENQEEHSDGGTTAGTGNQLFRLSASCGARR